MAGGKSKKDYQACLDRIAICKSSIDYVHIQKLIDEYYELRQEKVEMLEYMRKQCAKIERWSRVAKVSDYMKFFLGSFYRSKSNSAH